VPASIPTSAHGHRLAQRRCVRRARAVTRRRSAVVFAHQDGDETLPLTWENVDAVLDELRPYLIADGGNCSIRDIVDNRVKLLLEGACVGCPAAMLTMTMGIERRLKERIPDIVAVDQVSPEARPISVDSIEKVLDEVRPYLKAAGGFISVQKLMGSNGPHPNIKLIMKGGGSAIDSVKMEISHRLRQAFPSLGAITIN